MKKLKVLFTFERDNYDIAKQGIRIKKQTENEMVPVSTEVQVIDTVDDQAIVEIMIRQTIQDYVYSFKQGGCVVEGLTLTGINETVS